MYILIFNIYTNKQGIRGVMKEKAVLLLSSVPEQAEDLPTPEPYWLLRPHSSNSCSVFSHTVIGWSSPPVTLIVTGGPAPLPFRAILFATVPVCDQRLATRSGCQGFGAPFTILRL